MSTIREVIKTADQAQGVADEVKESLRIIMDMAQAKADLFDEQIEKLLIAGKTVDNLDVPITKVMKKHKEYRAIVEKGKTDIGKEILESFKQIFTGGEGIAKGIVGILETAFQTMMGAGQGVEGVTDDYEVLAEYPAIVRYDIKIWYRNIEAKAITKYMENAYAITAVKSVVDTTKLTFHDFIAFYGPVLRKAFGDDETKIKQFLKEAKEIYELFQGSNLSDADQHIKSFIENPEAYPKLKSQPFMMTHNRVTDGHV